METSMDGDGPALFRMSAGVFALRESRMLILKRAGGEMTGAWDTPGGGVDAGEDTEQAALRELREESGLVPARPVALVAIVPMHVYGHESFRVMYAANCPDGEVVLSEEHSDSRWIDPREYREQYLSDEVVARVAGRDARRGAMVRNVRGGLDHLIAWLGARA